MKIFIKKHNAEFGRLTLKNSVAHKSANPRSVLEQKLFSLTFYTTYWKENIFQHHVRVKPGQVQKYAIKTRKVRIYAEIGV